MPTQYQKPDDLVVIAQAVEVWGEGPEISPYPDNIQVLYRPGGGGPPAYGGTGVPAGGTTGQVLAKQSGQDYDTGWENGPWPLVVKATEPTAADYGEETMPPDAVWIQSTE